MKILLIEDEDALAEALAQLLKNNHYLVDIANDGEYGLDCALTGTYDLIILDIMLPKINGLDILKHLRETALATPILLLTAKDSLSDKVTGLDLGADDYLTKPFMTDELLARLRVLSRRKGLIAPSTLLTFSDLNFNPHTLEVTCQTKSLTLTLKEGNLLEFLMTHSEKICSKNELIEKIWGYDSQAEDNHVEVYISFLRKKLTYLQSQASIKTVRGLGYTLC